ncbi:MAG: hypothetical protein WC763_03240 [Candidatus Paceibacterota bacterium]|jgi:hypothetical protein
MSTNLPPTVTEREIAIAIKIAGTWFRVFQPEGDGARMYMEPIRGEIELAEEADVSKLISTSFDRGHPPEYWKLFERIGFNLLVDKKAGTAHATYFAFKDGVWMIEKGAIQALPRITCVFALFQAACHEPVAA